MIRLTDDEFEKIKSKAIKSGLLISSYVRLKALEAK